MVAFWNPLLKSFSWTHFVLKIYDFFSGGRLYARVAKLKFHNVCRESKNARKLRKSEKYNFRSTFGGAEGPWIIFRLPWVYFISTKKITYSQQITHLQISIFIILVLKYFLDLSISSFENFIFYQWSLSWRDQQGYESTKIQGAFIQCKTMIRRHVLLSKNILKRSLVTQFKIILVQN